MSAPSYWELLAEAKRELDAYTLRQRDRQRRGRGCTAKVAADLYCPVIEPGAAKPCGKRVTARGLCKQHHNQWLYRQRKLVSRGQ